MLFGIPEIKEYEKTCTDPYVLAIIKKLWESRSNAAKWNDAYIWDEVTFQKRLSNKDIADIITNPDKLKINYQTKKISLVC